MQKVILKLRHLQHKIMRIDAFSVKSYTQRDMLGIKIGDGGGLARDSQQFSRTLKIAPIHIKKYV